MSLFQATFAVLVTTGTVFVWLARIALNWAFYWAR